MSETIAPIKSSFSRAETATLRSRIPVIPFQESLTAGSKFTLVFFYNDPKEAVRQMHQMGAQKHYADEHGQRIQYTTATTAPRADMQPISVRMAGFLPDTTLTIIEPTTYKAYKARERADAGRTTSVVIDMPRDHGRINRGSSASRISPTQG